MTTKSGLPTKTFYFTVPTAEKPAINSHLTWLDNCQDIVTNYIQSLDGWAVTFKLGNDNCVVANKLGRIKLFKTLDNVYRQLHNRGISDIKILVLE